MRTILAMPNTFFASSSRLAGLAAGLCGVHCALTPVLVVAMPALALPETVERAVLVTTVCLGALILLMGPVRNHLTVVGVFVAGAAVWSASLAGWFSPAPEAATSSVGSLLVAGALLRSARLCRTGACDVCDDGPLRSDEA